MLVNGSSQASLQKARNMGNYAALFGLELSLGMSLYIEGDTVLFTNTVLQLDQ